MNAHRNILSQQQIEQASPAELLNLLCPVFPLLNELADTPQDAEWHSEGNVRIHTEMVIAEMKELLAVHPISKTLSDEQRLGMLLGAALHDIGKCLTTRESEIDGCIRISSPRHATRGRSYVAPRLPGLQFSSTTNNTALSIVGHHHDPRKMLSRSQGRSRFWRFARTADTQQIYLFEIADNKGRINRNGPAEAFEMLELFRISCEDYGVWGISNPYADWEKLISNELSQHGRDQVDYVLCQARRWHEAKEISTPHEALARSYEHRNGFAELVLTCGPSGAGKSEWIKQHLPDHTLISLDSLREEITGRRDQMKHEGQVLQLAKQRLRESLRKKERIVWDATNLRESGRTALIGLGHDYHAKTKIVAFATPPDELHRRNKKRKHGIPSAVIDRQLSRLEWPYAWEAHSVVTATT